MKRPSRSLLVAASLTAIITTAVAGIGWTRWNTQQLITTLQPIAQPIQENTQEGTVAENTSPSETMVLGEETENGNLHFSQGLNDYFGSLIISLSSEEPAQIALQKYEVNGPVTVTAYRITPADVLGLTLHEAEKSWDKTLDTNGREILLSKRYDAAELPVMIDLPMEATDIWYVQASNTTIKSYVIVVRSKTGVITKNGDGEFIFWAQDFASRKSAPNTTITTYQVTNELKELGKTVTNDQGVAKLPINDATDLAVFTRDADVGILPINLINESSFYWKTFPKQEDTHSAFVFTDRPLYQPGQEVQFKVIARDKTDGVPRTASGPLYAHLITGYSSDVMLSQPLQLGDTSATDGSFTLPKDAPTGYYTIIISDENSPDRDSVWRSQRGSSSFTVEYYRKPDYHLNLEGEQKNYLLGDSITLSLSGEYFSGQPLSNTEITYSVAARPYYDYYYLSDLERKDDSYKYGWWNADEKFTSGSVLLDKSGTAAFSVNTGEFPNSDKHEWLILTVTASFVDQTGNTVLAAQNFLVYGSEYGVFKSKYMSSQVVVGDTIELPLTIVTMPGNQPVAQVNPRITAVRSWYEWVQGEQGRKEHLERTEVVPLSTGPSNAQGEIAVQVSNAKAGSYTFTVQMEDPAGRKTTKKFTQYVSETRYNDNDEPLDPAITITSSSERYQPGDEVSINLSLDDSLDRDAFVSVQRERVSQYAVVPMVAGKGSVKFPVTELDMPNIYLTASTFTAKDLTTDGIDVAVSAERMRMKITLSPEATTVGPGETIGLQLTTTDGDNTPVSADVAVWLMDKSLLELKDSNLGDVFDYFWKHIYSYNRLSHSLMGIQTTTAAEGGGCFATGTQVLMADGSSKPIELVTVGDSVLTSYDSSLTSPIAKKVTAVDQTSANGVLIINESLKITANHKVFVNQQWAMAGSIQPGDTLVDTQGNPVSVTSVEWLLGKQPVYNLTIEDTHTYFANGVWVHNEKGEMRDTFQDVAYWNPKVRTDASGKASIRIPLPDNLTTWVVYAIGNTKETVVGQNSTEITVSKEVIVRPVLPSFIRQGDILIVSALIQNFTDTVLELVSTLQTNLGITQPAEPISTTVASLETAQEFWQVNSETASDSATFAFISENESIGDGVTVSIPVIPYGFREPISYAGFNATDFRIVPPTAYDPDKSIVTLYLSPTVLGSLPAAMEYLIGYPYGCVEQTTSSFVPLIIAKQHPDLFAEFTADKPVDEMINSGVDRLQQLQNSDGGWGWWQESTSIPFISVYVYEYLLAAKELGNPVSDEMLSNARYYFSKLDSSPRETVVRGYATALTANPTEEKIVIKESMLSTLSDDYLALAVKANVRSGITDPKENGAMLLEERGKQQQYVWNSVSEDGFYNSDATGMAIQALVEANYGRETASRAVQILQQERKYSFYSNTYSTAQTIAGIVDLYKSGEESTPNYAYTVQLNNVTIGEGKITSADESIAPIEIPINQLNATNTLTITKNGDGQLYSNLVGHFHNTDASPEAVEQGLSVERTYTNTRGPEYGLGVGETVEVTVSVKSPTDIPLKALVVRDPIPGGFVPINTKLNNERDTKTTGSFLDGVHSEFGLDSVTLATNPWDELIGSSKTFSYRARIVTGGEFSVPPAQAELMYLPEYHGRSNGEKLQITDEVSFNPLSIDTDYLGGSPSGIWVWASIAAIVIVLIALGLVVVRKKNNAAQHSIEALSSIEVPESGNTTLPTEIDPGNSSRKNQSAVSNDASSAPTSKDDQQTV